MNKIETAAVRISPAELTKEIMKSAAVQTAERLKTERVELRGKPPKNSKEG